MKKLIEALHVIQEECEKHHAGYGEYDCFNCPMGVEEGNCAVMDLAPYNWKINDEVQKALL